MVDLGLGLEPDSRAVQYAGGPSEKTVDWRVGSGDHGLGLVPDSRAVQCAGGTSEVAVDWRVGDLGVIVAGSLEM